MTHPLSSPAGRVHAIGGPEVMQLESVEVPAPGPQQIRIQQSAVGINYIDVYHRTGVYPIGLPAIIGSEAVGVVESVGSAVHDLRVGQRVTYAPVIGAYAQYRNLNADRAILVPDGLSDTQVAGMMLKGMTAHSLVRRAYPVKAGDTVLIQAAAGGVGLIVCQWAKHLGATVIGTVGSEEKAALVRAHGADHTILYRDRDFVQAVKDITAGAGVQAIFDGVGKDTFVPSLQCLAPFGTIVSFGQASGMVPPFDLVGLRTNSAYITRASLAIHVSQRRDLLVSAQELFEVVLNGAVRIDVKRQFKLSQAALAHRELEGRQTLGSSVFTLP